MPIPTLGFGHDCFPCPMRGCAYTLCNWSRVNFLCLTMKNSFQRAGCEAHKSGSVRGVVGRPAIPTRQIPPAAMRRGSRRQPGCRRRGRYRRYGPVHGRLLSGDGGACFRASVVGFARFTPFQGWWTLSSFEAAIRFPPARIVIPAADELRQRLGSYSCPDPNRHERHEKAVTVVSVVSWLRGEFWHQVGTRSEGSNLTAASYSLA